MEWWAADGEHSSPGHPAPRLDPAALEGIDAVIHLAAASSVDSELEDLLGDNVVGTYDDFEAAREHGVRRVVFASSSHVIGMYEADGARSIHGLDNARVYDASNSVRPDSMYGASKVFREALGRLQADRYGMDAACLRIRSVPGSSHIPTPGDARGRATPQPPHVDRRRHGVLDRCDRQGTDRGFLSATFFGSDLAHDSVDGRSTWNPFEGRGRLLRQSNLQFHSADPSDSQEVGSRSSP